MLRTWTVILGLGLAILWIFGVTSRGEAGWLSWLQLVAGIYSLLVAASVDDLSPRRTRVSNTLSISIGLSVLWILALVSPVLRWQAWWTFAFACAYLVLAIVTGARGEPPVEEPEQEDFRRTA
jgi:hypothetical protein